MSRDPVTISIPDLERERIKGRLRALKSVIGPQPRLEFECLEPVYTAAKEGGLEEFIGALERCSAEQSASFSNIISTEDPSGNTLLHVKAGIENDDILEILLGVIPDVTDDTRLAAVANKKGDTALHVAARAGRIRRAELLLDFGGIELVDRANKVGNTALHEAVKVDYNLTKLLLTRGSRAVCRPNKEKKSPLYVAVETENSQILELLTGAMQENELPWSSEQGISPVHGAVMHRNLGMLEKTSGWKKELFDSKDDDANTPLHLAAYENYVPGVEFLVREFASSAFKRNREGYLPIHVACKMGHLETIKVLRLQWPDLEELTSTKGENILHVAAKYGRASVVKYILGDRKLDKLINAKDDDGNTPVHVAAKNWGPEVLLSLTRDNRVDLKLVNHDNSTALDFVDERLNIFDAPLHKTLTRTILVSAGTPKSKAKAIFRPGLFCPPDLSILKDWVNTRMLVATLIAAMTFAAGFSVVGHDDSRLDAGLATLLNKPVYDIFVICNSIALYSSIIAVVILLWTQISDAHVVFRALRMTRLPLLIALATMSVAFMAGVYVTTSKRPWIAVFVMVVGITALSVILILYIAMFVPLGCKCRLLQFFADYIIRALILFSRIANGRDFRENPYMGCCAFTHWSARYVHGSKSADDSP